MGLLDKVVDTISNTSSEISQKARETSEKNRIKIENKKIEKEIEETIYKIGLHMINNEFEYVNKIMNEECNKITTLQNKLSKNLEDIKSINNSKTCVNCGRNIIQGSEFCVYCGAKISESIEAESSTVDLNTNNDCCTSCGNPIEKGALFCSFCGKKVDEKIPADNSEDIGDK